MAYTFDEMVRAYTDVHVGLAPTSAMQDNFRILAGLNSDGTVSDAQALSNLINGADASTAVAVMTYQFFTGKSPTQEGLAYLVNSTVNAADLNDPYYAKFNLENRYINFAANLGVNGAGALGFAAKYGAMSFADYVASIYETIIGAKYADAVGIDAKAAIAYLVGTRDAVLTTITEAGLINAGSTAAQVDIALKAAMAGLVMAASIKADVGLYAAATDNFMIALATHTAVYNTDITRTYAPTYDTPAHGTGKAIDRAVYLPAPQAPPGTSPTSLTFNLTAGTDTFAGSQFNDVFNADQSGAQLLTAGDVINGGNGADTLNIIDVVNQYGLAGPSVTVRNIETVNLRFQTLSGAPTYDMSNWTGVNTLNVTAFGGDLTLKAPTAADVALDMELGDHTLIYQGGDDWTMNLTQVKGGAVQVGAVVPMGSATVRLDHVAGASASGAVTVVTTGNISLTQTASNGAGTTAYLSRAVLGGGANTTSVVVRNAAEVTADSTHAGVAWATGGLASVQIVDKNWGSSSVGVIASIDVDGYRGLYIYDSGLTNLKLAHGSGNVSIDRTPLGGVPTTLNLSLDDVRGGVLSDGGGYTTLNITTGATASTLTNISAGALTTLNISGASPLTLGSATGMIGLQTVTVSGAAGITADLSNTPLNQVTSVDASATTGANTVKIDANKATFTGGSGVDTVTLAATTATKAIALGAGNDLLDMTALTGWAGPTFDGGAGTADVLRMTADQARDASLTPAFANAVTNFERLELTGSSNQTIDLAMLGNYHHVTTAGADGMTLKGLGSGDTLVLTDNGRVYNIDPANFGGTHDSFNLQLRNSTGLITLFAIDGIDPSFGINAAGVETLNITTVDTRAAPDGARMDRMAWLGNDVTAINISGNRGLTLWALSTALTSVDASGITLGDFAYRIGALTGAATVKGSANGYNTIIFNGVTGGVVTYTGGAGTDNVHNPFDTGQVINLGEGDNQYDTAGGDNTVTAGSGVDIAFFGNGNNTVNLGDGDSLAVFGSGNNSFTGGSGNDTVRFSGGINTIDVGSGVDKVTLLTASGTTSSFTTVTGMSPGTGDVITFNAAIGSFGPASSVLGSLAATIDAAASSTGAGASSVASWFVFGGDTYVVFDNSNNGAFAAGVDSVIKLAGVLDLSASTFSGSALTL